MPPSKFKSGVENPFELKFTKRKHNVLNRKVKGTRGNPGNARKTSQLQRSKTLVTQKSTSNFSDKRFGENDPGMSLQDKQMARYMAERNKKSFNLEDNSEDELTHLGQSLSQMDDEMFQKKNESDDEGNGFIDKHTVHAAHFGGFDDDPDRKKSKNEVMQEIIQKSKFHKAERQRLRDENQDLMQDVDAELDDIRSLLVSAPKQDQKFEKTDYDVFVKELAAEKRGKPSDRLKTEEEIARQEKERLEEMEVCFL